MSVAKLQKRIRQEETLVNPKKDIYGMVKDFTLKKVDRPPEEELRPTRANLAGLAVRFKMSLSGNNDEIVTSPKA